jgi:predicted dehydrogenase
MTTRRDFLKAGTALTAGALFPNLGYGATSASALSPNDKVNVALIGCRNMGWANLSDFLKHENVLCVSLCDVNLPLMEKRATELQGKYQQKATLYKDYRRILDRKDVDIVIIGTPDHWHCLQFTDACAAGKSVYVEKPIANSMAECDAMVYAANRYNTVVQVGQQQRSANHWKKMIDYIQEGHLGTIGQVNVWANFNYAAIPIPVADTSVPEGVDFDLWLGPAPKVPFNSSRFNGLWRVFWDYGGGLLTDWGVHLLDMALWGMGVAGMPEQTVAVGGNYFYPNGGHETYDSLNVTYRFERFVINWSNNAGIETGLGGRNYGVMFRGTNGSLVADRNNWEIIPEKDKIPYLKEEADYKDHENHVTNFLRCVDSGNRDTACPIETGSLSAKYAHIGNISARIGGQPLVYNDRSGRFDNEAANRLLKPEYHNGYKFPRTK